MIEVVVKTLLGVFVDVTHFLLRCSPEETPEDWRGLLIEVGRCFNRLVLVVVLVLMSWYILRDGGVDVLKSIVETFTP